MDTQRPIAIVTGGGSGIGAASAAALEREGALVVRFDLNIEGENCHAVDISKDDQVAAAVAAVEKQFGRIDILVNSAGVGGMGTMSEITPAQWDAVMNVNLRGTFLMCHAVLPGMKERKSGSIVNIGSTFGMVAREGAVAYSVSKGAVIHLTKTMAVDLQDAGVRVNCVCPGIIVTPMTAELFTPEYQSLHERNLAIHAMRRAGTPEEVAEAVAFLASERASYITGSTLPVDGGYTSGKWLADA